MAQSSRAVGWSSVLSARLSAQRNFVVYFDKNFGSPRYRLFQGNEGALRRAGTWAAAALLDDELAITACQRGMGHRLVKAQDEFHNAAGGFVVPTEVESEINAVRDIVGVFRREATNYVMTTETTAVPKREGGLTAAFYGEGAQIAESQASWSNIGLTAKKLGAL